MAKEEEEKVEEKKVEGWVVGEVATQTSPVIIKGEESLDVYAALCKVLNDLDVLKEGVLGLTGK